MIHTYLSSRGYSVIKKDLDINTLIEIQNELNVSPFIPADFACSKPVSFKLFQESSTKIYLPKAYGLKKFGLPLVNKLTTGIDIDIEFKGLLRPEQQEPVKRYLDAAEDPIRMGGVITMACGGGKTTISIYIMCKLKKKTLIVVHKNFLLQQWKDRIEQFAPTANIGILKAKKLDVDDKDVVIASLQSLSMKDYDENLFKGFGFVVYDECHHLSAEVFSNALKKVNVTYSLGLSATPKRKDGLTKVFLWHLGNIVYNPKKVNDIVDVNIIEYFDNNSNYSREEYMFKGKLNMPRMINNICNYLPRIEFIINLIKDTLEIESDRKILILSDRRNHIDAIIDKVKEAGIDAAPYYGGLKQLQLKRAEKQTVIGGTYAMAAEGLDIRGLDTLILASPKSDIIQCVGRVLRDKPEDRNYTPKIIDIVDNFSIFLNQAKKRAKYYAKCKYNIVDTIFVDKTKVNLPLDRCLIIDDV